MPSSSGRGTARRNLRAHQRVRARRLSRRERVRCAGEKVTKSLSDSRLRSFRFSAETETLVVSGADLEIRSRGGDLVINPNSSQAGQFVRVDRESGGDVVSRDRAKQVRVTVEPVNVRVYSPGQSMV